MRLVAQIEEAAGIDGLENVSACRNKGGTHFVYNRICKVYFERYGDTNEVKLLGFAFGLASDSGQA